MNAGIRNCARRNCTRSARRASAPTTRTVPIAVPGSSAAWLMTRAGLRLGLGRGVPGDREEHVVERRLLDLDRVDLDARLVERADDGRDRARALGRAQHEAAAVALGAGAVRGDARRIASARARGVDQLDVQVRLADAVLEVVRRALGDDACRGR